MQKVIIFGNGQPAEVNYVYLTNDSQYEVAAFTVDRAFIKQNSLMGLPVVAFEDIESIYSPDKYKMSILISYRKLNRLREEKYLQAKAKGYELINYISSKAVVWPDLSIGDNCLIGENTSISPFVEIGNNVFIGPGCLIGHHSIIKDNCFIGPNAVILGSTTIEPYCLIGANSTIRDGGVVIAKDCIIGTGVSITKDTKEGGIYINKPPEYLSPSHNTLNSMLTFFVKPYKPD